MFRFLFVALFLIPLAVPALAQSSPHDGAHFLGDCNQAVKMDDDLDPRKVDFARAMYCAGFVKGYVDAIVISDAIAPGTFFICLPNSLAPMHVTRVFVKYLQDHPESLHEQGRLLLQLALIKAYPCKK
jgi:hypothetical protein